MTSDDDDHSLPEQKRIIKRLNSAVEAIRANNEAVIYPGGEPIELQISSQGPGSHLTPVTDSVRSKPGRTKKKHLSLKRTTELLFSAQEFRRRFFHDEDVFDPLRVLEHGMLLLYPTLTVDIVETLEVNGEPASAAVTFDKDIRLEITEETYLGAANTSRKSNSDVEAIRSAQDAFSISHEIAHIVLHSQAFKSRLDRSLQLARGTPGSGTSFRTNIIEEKEANVFAGGLMIPVDALLGNIASMDYRSMRLKYRVSQSVAEKAVRQAKAVQEAG